MRRCTLRGPGLSLGWPGPLEGAARLSVWEPVGGRLQWGEGGGEEERGNSSGAGKLPVSKETVNRAITEL